MSESESAKLAAIAWIREQMDNYALTLDDLMAAGCFDGEPSAGESGATETPGASELPAPPDAAVVQQPPKKAAPLYRNALGQSWDGTGEYPDWLQRAVNAGQSIDFYRVE
ncbi:H-NS family nucleoid-associated regulatory protein [Cupriavidus sp. WKF15]|uniref:H-NS family nucleoid-associated regulatory protein n=1 Tax=Cupriavidus sp. WKF15 TaxID=3032282 RepID=UPI0023E12584|nr:H-NS family nucleoid-associated regulatory protein [Cupriavidus sp. WKF15]WER48201.1 H-NS family nucleoid-associated regulatory protein [Cupriavidus sp. WKF15]